MIEQANKQAWKEDLALKSNLRSMKNKARARRNNNDFLTAIATPTTVARNRDASSVSISAISSQARVLSPSPLPRSKVRPGRDLSANIRLPQIAGAEGGPANARNASVPRQAANQSQLVNLITHGAKSQKRNLSRTLVAPAGKTRESSHMKRASDLVVG